MMISLKAKLAFLAIPKAGSTAIEAAIGPHCEIQYGGHPRIKHMNARRFERHMRPYLRSIGHEDIETLCLMREPIDWLASWWRYRRRDEIKNTPQSTANISFSDFCQSYIAEDPAIKSIGRPSRFVTDGTGARAVTHLFAYENMGAVVSFLEDRLGQPITLEHRNVSPEAEASLDPRTKARTEAFLAPEYELYQSLTG